LLIISNIQGEKMKKDKFEVNLDEQTNILSVHIKVEARPGWKGLSYYDMTRVLTELKKLNYKVSEKDCFDKSRPVRSDDGERNASGVWKFKLPKKETVQPPKPPKPSKPLKSKQPKPAATKSTTDTTDTKFSWPGKNTATKKTSGKTKKNVLK